MSGLRSIGGSDPSKLPLAGGTMTGLLEFSGTTHAGVRLISLTTAERDALTPSAGDVIYNETTSNIEGYDGSSWLDLGAGASGGISDVVDDITPQLGGQLDVNGNAIGDGTLELLVFSETGSAVNHLQIANAATGNAPELAAVGDDSNIDMELAGKGTGSVIVSSSAGNLLLGTTTADASAVGVLTIGNGTAPSGGLADAVQVYSADRAAGKAGLAITAEDGTEHILADRIGLATVDPQAMVHLNYVDTMETILGIGDPEDWPLDDAVLQVTGEPDSNALIAAKHPDSSKTGAIRFYNDADVRMTFQIAGSARAEPNIVEWIADAGDATDPAELRLNMGANGPLTFYTNDTERIRIDGDGNVCVGADDAQSLLDVRGAAGEAGILTLSTEETTVVDGDELGRINFQSPSEGSGTDAVLVAAAIYAEADDTFAADNNTTDIVFATGESEAATEKMRLKASGTLIVQSIALAALEDDSTLGATPTIDFSASNHREGTLSANCTPTFTAPNGPANLTWKVTQNGTGGYDITWPATAKKTSGADLAPASGANEITVYAIWYDGANYYVAKAIDNAVSA